MQKIIDILQISMSSYSPAQLGEKWPNPIGKTHKHSLHNTGEESDSCKFLGQWRYCRPVVHAWVYSASLATITTPGPATIYTLMGGAMGRSTCKQAMFKCYCFERVKVVLYSSATKLIAKHDATGILINEIRNTCMGKSLVLAALAA